MKTPKRVADFMESYEIESVDQASLLMMTESLGQINNHLYKLAESMMRISNILGDMANEHEEHIG